MPNCIWFRQDLRVKDNTALQAASQGSKEGLIGLYVIAHDTWRQHFASDVKIDFILRQLTALSQALQKYNIPLKILIVKRFKGIPLSLCQFCKTHDVNSVFVNKELLLDEIKRDDQVRAALTSRNIPFFEYDDLTILHPNDTLKKDGTPFKVFTAFRRNWLSVLNPAAYFSDDKRLKKQVPLKISSDPIPLEIPGFSRTPNLEQRWPVGEIAAHKALKKFAEHPVTSYNEQRDIPSQEGTSRLSPYLASGLLSPRQCVTALCDVYGVNDIYQLISHDGASTWVNELIWREFYYAIAYLFPQVVKNQPLKTNTKRLRWSKSEKNFKAWCEGKTGFPFVDAGMRQLNQTGWMHNRLRMVTAMFLTKTLFINWRWGERYFMRHLVDGDFASNNGGWQWCASTGVDAVPYFRIFNPITQGQRFDPEGDFIRHYCPELSSCTNKEIHNPSLELREKLGYPYEIVDYSLMRAKVLAAFKALSD